MKIVKRRKWNERGGVKLMRGRNRITMRIKKKCRREGEEGTGNGKRRSENKAEKKKNTD